MEKVILAHLKALKQETIGAIYEKLENIESKTKEFVMKVFNQKSYKDLLDSTMAEWKEQSLKKN